VAFSFTTQEKQYVFRAGARQNNGYTAAGKRDYILKVYLPVKPTRISMAGKNLVAQPFTAFNATAGKVLQKANWSWDEKNSICYIRLADDGKEKQVEIAR
jgi:hypothetical protein